MTRVAIFTATIGAGSARLTISVARNFESDPFTVTLGSDNWPLSTQDAERLASAGRRIEGALDFAAQRGEPVEEAPFFRRQLGNPNGRAVTFELGIDAGGPVAAVYLEWGGRQIVDGSGRLLKMLQTIAEATATVRRAEAPSGVHDIRIDPQTFRSPYGWNGQ
jgi:hypothetical protein